MHFNLNQICVATILLGLTSVVSATEADVLPVVITASKQTEPQKNVTQKVSVVTQEEFAQVGSPKDGVQNSAANAFRRVTRRLIIRS